MLSQLRKEFMAISCTHVYKLTILVKKGIVLPTSLKENNLRIRGKEDPQIASTACSAEHKVLRFALKKELTQSLYLILQQPIIRLKEIALLDIKKHPDLQTTKLTIDLSEIDEIFYSHRTTFKATTQPDIVALFALPSLQKITIIGKWGKYEGIELGLIQGLLSRSRSLPLRKLSLEVECNNLYKMADFKPFAMQYSLFCNSKISSWYLERDLLTCCDNLGMKKHFIEAGVAKDRKCN